MWTRKQAGCSWFWVLLHTQDTEEQTAVSRFPRARPLRPGVKPQPNTPGVLRSLQDACRKGHRPQDTVLAAWVRAPEGTVLHVSLPLGRTQSSPVYNTCSVLSCLLWQYTEASELISQHPHINRSHSSGSIRRRGFHWFQIQLYLGLLEEPQSW